MFLRLATYERRKRWEVSARVLGYGLVVVVCKSFFEDLDERDHQERDCSTWRAGDMKGRSKRSSRKENDLRIDAASSHIKTHCLASAYVNLYVFVATSSARMSIPRILTRSHHLSDVRRYSGRYSGTLTMLFHSLGSWRQQNVFFAEAGDLLSDIIII